MKSILAGRAAAHSLIRSDIPLTDSQIQSVAPSIYAPAPHDSRSDRYQYIPTINVLNGLREQGFQPFMVAQARVGKKGISQGKQDYTRHMIRMRHADSITMADGAHEIILLNSHDGTSSYQILSGIFRFVCMNGMVCGDVETNTRVMHKGKEIEREVLEGVFRVLDKTQRNQAVIDDMMSSTMKTSEQVAFAQAAIGHRFGAGNNVITPAQALEIRRTEDKGNDQWSIFNRVQENLINGGMMGRSTNNRERKVRAIVGMDKDISFNRSLWNEMQEYRAA